MRPSQAGGGDVGARASASGAGAGSRPTTRRRGEVVASPVATAATPSRRRAPRRPAAPSAPRGRRATGRSRWRSAARRARRGDALRAQDLAGPRGASPPRRTSCRARAPTGRPPAAARSAARPQRAALAVGAAAALARRRAVGAVLVRGEAERRQHVEHAARQRGRACRRRARDSHAVAAVGERPQQPGVGATESAARAHAASASSPTRRSSAAALSSGCSGQPLAGLAHERDRLGEDDAP